MGVLLPNFKQSIIDNILYSITSNDSNYYVCGSNPVPDVSTPDISTDVYDEYFLHNWDLLFGKKLANTDIVPVIRNIPWVSNTIYDRYDNTIEDLDQLDYYVITSPSELNGNYLVFKCIDNANGAPSTQIPDKIQPNSFTKSDGYTWRYITTISAANYSKFATTNYVPIAANAEMTNTAFINSGIEVVVISSEGMNYSSYGNGIVQGVVNSTVIQIGNDSSVDNDFYTNNSIYFTNNDEATSQLRIVSHYISNSIGNWIYLNTPANTQNIQVATTEYLISPRVQFESDATVPSIAYATINAISNTINSVVIIDTGYGVSWANAQIISNTSYGSGANVYAICPPPGGHGFNVFTELSVQGLGIAVKFSNTESNTIPVNVNYNRINVIRNPKYLNSNNSIGNNYTANTFSSVLQANLSPPTSFSVGMKVIGQTTNSLGTVAFCNSTNIFLTGDKSFENGEIILGDDDITTAVLSINTLGDIYTKDIQPLYIENISNVERSNSQSESYKLIIKL